MTAANHSTLYAGRANIVVNCSGPAQDGKKERSQQLDRKEQNTAQAGSSTHSLLAKCMHNRASESDKLL